MKPLKNSKKKVTATNFKRNSYTQENLHKALKEISKVMSKKLKKQNFGLVPQDIIVEEIHFIEAISTQQIQIQETYNLQPLSQSSPIRQTLNQLEFIEQVLMQKDPIPQTSCIQSPSNSTNISPQQCIQQSATQLPTSQKPTIPQSIIQQPSTQEEFVASLQKPSIRVTSDVKVGADQKNLLQTIRPLDKGNNTRVKLQDILVVPKTPNRKGVKNTTKMPFVLTSAEWKAQENEKIRVKEEKAEGIKKRKEERERKKLEKENKPQHKTKIKNKTNNETKNELTRILFSEEFYKFEDGKADNVIENIEKQNKPKTSARKSYTTAEIEKMLLTDSDD